MELTRENMEKEVSMFRSRLAAGTVQNSEESLKLRREGNIGIIEFDCVGEKVNKLSTSNMIRLLDLAMEVEADDTLTAMIILSRKEKIFIAGADISEIQSLRSEESDVAEALGKLQSIFTYIENLPIPTIAAIHGVCLGGGLELALSCDYRIVTDAPETKLGLPEVQLGVLPGWGGTQRLPKLIGLEKSLDLILTGRQIDGKSALRYGVAERLCPKEILDEKALEWARELSGTRTKQEHKAPALMERVLRAVPGGTWIIFDQARKSVLKKTQGNYPAPLKAIDVISKTFGGDLESGLKVEAKAFAELVMTDVSANLIRLFFLTEKIKKDKGTDSGIAGKPIKHAGVLGAGVMGGGIAQLFAAKDVRVRMKDLNWDAITKGYEHAYELFKKRLKRRKMIKSDVDNKMALIEGTTSYSGFHSLDLVVEAVVENLDVKKSVFAELDKKTNPNAILATNTSSLSVGSIAEATQNPDRVVGMHFFNPVDKMPLVEVIRGPKTSDEAVATIVDFSRKLGKTPVVVMDAPGFVVNRILGPYLNEAVHLLLEGVSVKELDKLMLKFGMPMGPCVLLDEVGLDVAGKVAKVLFGAFGERMKPPSFMDTVTEGGRLGKKTKKGIYKYSADGKREEVDESVFEGAEIQSRESSLTDEVIINRMVFMMVNEAARILEEKVVRHVHDLDVAMIFGTGFAPFRGGLLRYADTVGPDTIVTELDMYARQYGARFQACQYLQELAVNGKKFYDAEV